MWDYIHMINKNNYFPTQNLALASAIQAISTSKLEYVDFIDPQRAEFVFDRTKDPSFDEIIARFWSKQLPIDASTYFDSLRLIKARLYERQNEQE